ncbi:MAG TPA: hypothetical protein VJX67_11905 [Blastocatellia bacterium]|nr:hypothetical protein [Blastocatellia bacterium]
MSMSKPTSSEVKFGDWISEGWKMFAEQWKGWVIHSLVAVVIISASIVPFFIVVLGLGAFSDAAGAAAAPMLIVLLSLLFMVISMIVSGALVSGMYASAFKQLQGGAITVRDLFSRLDRLPAVVGASLLIGILTMIGFVLCVIPAFLVMGLFYFTIPLIVFEDMGVIDAMKASKEVAERNIWMFTLFAFVVALIAQAGSYACYVGILATYPLHFTIGVIAYRDCFGVPGARSFASATAPHAAPYSPQYPQPPFPPPYGPQYPPPAPPAGSPQYPPAEQGSSVCPFCNGVVPPNARFCPNCRASLEG